MVVYLDLVILQTVLVNTLMIMGIECILNGKLSIIRVILSNLVLVLSLSLYLINIKELIFIRNSFCKSLNCSKEQINSLIAFKLIRGAIL